MTTSGVSSYNPDFDEIITEAYERCGMQVRDGYDVLSARRSLNLMFAEWANRGLNLYTIEQRQVVLVANTFEYSLPDDTVDVLSAVIRTNSQPASIMRIDCSTVPWVSMVSVVVILCMRIGLFAPIATSPTCTSLVRKRLYCRSDGQYIPASSGELVDFMHVC